MKLVRVEDNVAIIHLALYHPHVWLSKQIPGGFEWSVSHSLFIGWICKSGFGAPGLPHHFISPKIQC